MLYNPTWDEVTEVPMSVERAIEASLQEAFFNPSPLGDKEEERWGLAPMLPPSREVVEEVLKMRAVASLVNGGDLPAFKRQAQEAVRLMNRSRQDQDQDSRFKKNSRVKDSMEESDVMNEIVSLDNNRKSNSKRESAVVLESRIQDQDQDQDSGFNDSSEAVLERQRTAEAMVRVTLNHDYESGGVSPQVGRASDQDRSLPFSRPEVTTCLMNPTTGPTPLDPLFKTWK